MELTEKNECHYCIYHRHIPYNAHVYCINPDKQMIGHKHGIKNGWFAYPVIFDPVWKLKKCRNFKKVSDLKEKKNESRKI